MNFNKCEKILNHTFKKHKLHDAVLFIENIDGSISWNHGINTSIDELMNMASITKLFVTTCILQLIEQKKLDFDEKISPYFDEKIMKGLHVYRGVDYSDTLTIRDLLFQVSGLPDYFFCKSKNEESFEKTAFEGNKFLTFDEYISVSKRMKPIFAPRKKGHAYYADINFDLLGIILEKIYGIPLPQIYKKNIFEPLGLQHTYAVSEEKNFAPKIYRKGKEYTITDYLRGFPASGGGITTARELMTFLKAFWTGKLFSSDLLSMLKEYNRLQIIYGSVQYSGGHMYINANFPFHKKHVLRGHSGATGSIAFYCEETGMFFVSNLNFEKSYVPINMLLQIENCCR